MAAIHYHPWHSDDLEVVMCGTMLGEHSEITGEWARVTCKKCISKKVQIESLVDSEEKDIVNQMGDMADFFAREQATEDGE